MRRDLYATADLRARFVDIPDATGALCVVTFDSFSNTGSLDRPGFGESFFESRGVPAIHVLSRRNLWYQEADLPDLLAAVRDATARFTRVLSYGSSMGGYGAIRYGGAVGAHQAVAISPQYSLDPLKVPFEHRWGVQSRTLRFVHEALALPRVARATVFYDPRDLDRRHVELYARDYAVDAVPLPYAGHPAGSYLAETGLLQAALTEIGQDRFDARDFEARARTVRRRSGQYLFTLARRQPMRRVGLKSSLARLAVEASPNDPEYLGFLGFTLDHESRTDEAADSYLRALRHGSDQPLALERYGRHLLRTGRAADALDVLHRAMAPNIGLPRVERTYGLALLANRRWLPATRALATLLRRHPNALWVVLHEAALVLRWIASGRRRHVPGDRAPIPFTLHRDLTTVRKSRRTAAQTLRPL